MTLGQAAGYKMYTHNPFNKQKNVVNTRSGVLLMDYKNKKIIPLGKKPENMFSYCVDCEYNPDADATEIDNIYRNVVGHQQIDIIYQIPALALIHTDIELTPTKIAYIFLGKSNTGKSIVQTGYAKLFGTETVSKISMHEIVNNKFVKPMLEGKLLNLDDELPEALQSAETREIKAITGTKEHTLEPKNQKPYNGIISCILVFAGNQLPKLTVSKHAKAFWERFDIVSFKAVFPTNDEFINQTFTENNKSAMLNKVLEKMFEIKDSTGSKCNIKRCIPKENIFDVWQKSSSTVYQCIMDITFPSNEIEMYEKRKLFQIYENWCDSNNIPFDDSRRIWSLDEMGRTLNNLSLAKNVHHEQGASGRYWLMRRGLKLEWYLPEDKAALGSFMSENLEQYINEAEEFSEEFSEELFI